MKANSTTELLPSQAVAAPTRPTMSFLDQIQQGMKKKAPKGKF